MEFLLDWLEAQPAFAAVTSAGHRVVHGLKHFAPELVTPKLLAALRRATPYDPEHLPREIALIEAVRRRHPRLPQVACFDTAFHRTMPRVAKLLPIPRRYAAQGVERYGFHGLSYAYLMEELGRLDPAAAQGRVILAHLGNGASLAAVRHGRSIDTSMGFTPAAGLVMSTRSGDLDPGLLSFLARTRPDDAGSIPPDMVNHESGLLGVSGTSSDVRDLLAREKHPTARAAEARRAVLLFRPRSASAPMPPRSGGLDALVFAGGIGENAPVLRQRICDGASASSASNSTEARNSEKRRRSVISTGRQPACTVRVIRTDEEIMIARSIARGSMGLG